MSFLILIMVTSTCSHTYITNFGYATPFSALQAQNSFSTYVSEVVCCSLLLLMCTPSASLTILNVHLQPL